MADASTSQPASQQPSSSTSKTSTEAQQTPQQPLEPEHQHPSAASAAEPQASAVPQQEAVESEDPNECGWCKWMKAGGCKAEFEVWLKCVDAVRDAGRDDVESCADVMGPLWDCMAKNSSYYAPQLDALKGKGTDGGAGERGEALADAVGEVGEDLGEALENILENFDLDDGIDTD